MFLRMMELSYGFSERLLSRAMDLSPPDCGSICHVGLESDFPIWTNGLVFQRGFTSRDESQ